MNRRDLPTTYAVVVCTETDDYAPPRGIDLDTGALFTFSSLLASCECPAGVDKGLTYVVWATGPRAGLVVGEHVDQRDPRALRVLHDQCSIARVEGRHRPWTVNEANLNGLLAQWWQDMAAKRCRGCWVPMTTFGG